MIKKINLLLNTVRYLKPIQVFYQIRYRLNKPRILSEYSKIYNTQKLWFLSFKKLPPVYISYLGKNEFVFLNVNLKFNSTINWNFQENGKLWNYNLQYCNYLLQKDLNIKEKLGLALSLYDWLYCGKLPLEPYPASLRIINAIRLFSEEHKAFELLFPHVHAELDFLSKRPEYHLLGNHLLENGFALMMGGAFFSNADWLKLGKKILEKQLQEQILLDGGHFELSPMYHQIIFFRVLELIDWYSNWHQKEKDFEEYLIHKAAAMLRWLEKMSFGNGDTPHFNDSSDDISFSRHWLVEYANELGVKSSNTALSSSGYRSVQLGNYECKIDVGQLGPSYQPGHAHADALSFILYYKNEPLFVEVGTSTYQPGEIRNRERSTSSHNTVVVNNKNQSIVWGGFRVAERARVKILKDTFSEITATHDGYRKEGIAHVRNFAFKDDVIFILDKVHGNDSVKNEFHLHVYPGIEITIKINDVVIQERAVLEFEGAVNIRTEEYEMADGFNKILRGKKIIVGFEDRLQTKICFKH